MSETFETTDLELVERALSSDYANIRIAARGERHGMRMSHAALGPAVRLDYLDFAMRFDAQGAPLNALYMGEVKSGLLRCGSDGSERPMRTGQVYLAALPGDPFTVSVDASVVEMFAIDPALPDQTADTGPGRARRPVRFTGYEPVSARDAQLWKDTSAFVRNTALAYPGVTEQPLLTSTLTGLLVAAALTVFPNTALTDPTIEDRHDAHPATLRRAIAFIDEYAHTDITVAGIAAAACVSIRAVQLAFRRYLDTTPMGYLRRIRLDRAHRQLLAADPERDTITAVAHHWGFPSSSRFAAAYRQAYGVAPSRTMQA